MQSVDLNALYRSISPNKADGASEKDPVAEGGAALSDVKDKFGTDTKGLKKADSKQTRKIGLDLTQELQQPLLSEIPSQKPTISGPTSVKVIKQSLVAANWDAFIGADKNKGVFKTLSKSVDAYKKANKGAPDQQEKALNALFADVQKAVAEHKTSRLNPKTKALEFAKHSEKLDDFALELASLLNKNTVSTAENQNMKLLGATEIDRSLNQKSIKNNCLRESIGRDVTKLIEKFGDKMAELGDINPKELSQINQFLDKLTGPVTHSSIQDLLSMDTKSTLIQWAQTELDTLYLSPVTKAPLEQVGELPKIVDNFIIDYDASVMEVGFTLESGGGGQVMPFRDLSPLTKKVINPNNCMVTFHVGQALDNNMGDFSGRLSNYQSMDEGCKFILTSNNEVVDIFINKEESTLTINYEGTSMSASFVSEQSLDTCFEFDEKTLLAKVLNPVMPEYGVEYKEDVIGANYRKEVSILAEVELKKLEGSCSGIMGFKGLTKSDNGKYTIVMQNEGGNLSDFMQAESLSFEDQLSIAKQVTEGVNELHTVLKGTHNDIKLKNVTAYRADDGAIVAKVIDLGEFSGFEKGVSRSEAFSPGYASPEQLRHLSPLTDKSDVFGLGNTLISLRNRGNLIQSEPGELDMVTASDYRRVMDDDGVYETLIQRWLTKNIGTGELTNYDVMLSEMVAIKPEDRLPLNMVLDLLNKHSELLSQSVTNQQDIMNFKQLLRSNMEAYNFTNELKTLRR
jgi:hypothetical protein